MSICTKCKQRVAIVYTSHYEDGQRIDEGYCIKCAYESGLSGITEMFSSAGINDDNIDEMSEKVEQMLGGTAASQDPTDFFKALMSGDFDAMGMGDGDDEPFDIFDDNPAMGVCDAADSDEDSESENDETEDGKGKNPFDMLFGGKKSSKQSKTKDKKLKYLNEFGTDLTKRAAEGKIDRILCRDKEIDRMVQILNRRSKNNPVLIGAPGVGKTAVAQGLALKIVEGNVPAKLLNMRVWQLDLPAMVAGTQFRGQFEARMKGVINEAIKEENIILVIDELHSIMGAGDAEGSTNAANILKPALARGELRIIGSTTVAEYRKIEKDTALERRFQKILVEEPSVEDAIEIVKGIKDYYEEHHGVTYSDDVIAFAVNASKRYITERYLPDKAIDLIDEAGSRANLENTRLVKIEENKKALAEAKQKYDKLSESVSEKPSEELDNTFAQIAELKSQIDKLEKEYAALTDDLQPDPITKEDIARVVEMWTGIPLKSVSEDESVKLLNLEARLHERVIGQEEAVSAVARAIRRNRSGFTKKHKPASFIFVGPTGVGKTELVKALAQTMFDTEDALIRIDMSEYMEAHSVSKMIGSPPGYVGHDDAGQLTEQVRRKPYSVVLFDEIEKAHPDVYNLLLQLLDEGRLTDSHGLHVNFENTVIIMTSNAGNSIKANTIGFENQSRESLEARVNSALKETFRPEFLNRVDETIIFNELNHDEIRKIVDIMVKEVFDSLKEKGISATLSKSAGDELAKRGYDPKYGARPLRKAIRSAIEDKLSDMFFEGKLNNVESLKIDFVDGEFKFVPIDTKETLVMVVSESKTGKS